MLFITSVKVFLRRLCISIGYCMYVYRWLLLVLLQILLVSTNQDGSGHSAIFKASKLTDTNQWVSHCGLPLGLHLSTAIYVCLFVCVHVCISPAEIEIHF